jgi:hypothetical protein
MTVTATPARSHRFEIGLKVKADWKGVPKWGDFTCVDRVN